MSTTEENPGPTPKLNVVAAPPNTVKNRNKKKALLPKKKKQNDAKEKPEVEDGYTPLKYRRCCVATCRNSYKASQLFPFPNDKRLYQWKKLAGVAKGRHRKNRHFFICAEHFKEEDFVIVKKKRTLNEKAIPSEKLPLVHPTLTECMGLEVLSLVSDTALKLDDTIKEIVYYQKYKGRTYKDVQLNFYLAHPNAYKQLIKPFNLIEPLLLKQTLIKIKNLHQIVAKKLAVMSPKQKICMLFMGNILMTPHVYYDHKFDKLIGFIDTEYVQTLPHLADRAHFLVLCGIYENWNIPLDIFYSDFDEKKRKAKNWLGGLGEVLENTLKDIVKVVIILPDFNITQVNIISQPRNSKPFQAQLIESLTIDLNIIVLYDIQFLIKVLLYSLKNWHYSIPGPTKQELVTLTHLSELITVDSTSTCSLLPHFVIPPSNFKELKLETVLEIFSKNTVTALQAYIELELISKEAEGMLIFIGKISSLLDIFRNKIQDKREIISILSDVETMFSNLTVYKYASKIELKHTAIDYLIITLKSLKTLFNKDSELFMAVTKKLLKTYTNDFCEKNKDKSRGEPTVKLVNNKFKRSSVENILKPCNNVKVDFNNAIDLFIEHLRAVIPQTIFTNTSLDLEIKLSESKIYFSDHNDKLIYLSGYLLKKCSEKHSCDSFNKYLENTNNYTIDSLMLDVANGNCLMPNIDLVNYIELLEMMFIAYFPKVIFRVGIIKGLMKVLGQVGFKMPCLCFPLKYLVQLFICIRIENVVRFSNLEVKLGKRLYLEPVSIVYT